MQNDRPVREAVSDLNAMGVEYAFVHEAACVLFGVSFYASVLKIDVLAPPASFRKLVRRLPRRNGFERSLPGGRTVRARSPLQDTPHARVHRPRTAVGSDEARAVLEHAPTVPSMCAEGMAVSP